MAPPPRIAGGGSTTYCAGGARHLCQFCAMSQPRDRPPFPGAFAAGDCSRCGSRRGIQTEPHNEKNARDDARDDARHNMPRGGDLASVRRSRSRPGSRRISAGRQPQQSAGPHQSRQSARPDCARRQQSAGFGTITGASSGNISGCRPRNDEAPAQSFDRAYPHDQAHQETGSAETRCWNVMPSLPHASGRHDSRAWLPGRRGGPWVAVERPSPRARMRRDGRYADRVIYRAVGAG